MKTRSQKKTRPLKNQINAMELEYEEKSQECFTEVE